MQPPTLMGSRCTCEIGIPRCARRSRRPTSRGHTLMPPRTRTSPRMLCCPQKIPIILSRGNTRINDPGYPSILSTSLVFFNTGRTATQSAGGGRRACSLGISGRGLEFRVAKNSISRPMAAKCLVFLRKNNVFSTKPCFS